ncbi:hypothetical protein GCM10022245_08690 [Streptomyces mayteni]
MTAAVRLFSPGCPLPVRRSGDQAYGGVGLTGRTEGRRGPPAGARRRAAAKAGWLRQNFGEKSPSPAQDRLGYAAFVSAPAPAPVAPGTARSALYQATAILP